MEPVTILGVIGAAIILIAFSFNQIGKWSTENKVYDWFNATGSLILIIYALLIDSLPFVVLNSIWFAVSLRDIVKSFKK